MKKENWKKYLIGAIVIAIIILLIIWYRNSQKAKQTELAKSKLITGGSTPVPVVISAIGKTAVVKSSTTFYNVGTMSVAYTKNVAGEFVGTITADKTDGGNTAFYKVTNTAGTQLYVLKTTVTVQ